MTAAQGDPTWELVEDAEDASWALWRLDDLSYSLWAMADSEGFWVGGHSTWSREDGPEEHEDQDGSTQSLDEAKVAAEAWMAEKRTWLDEYERQVREAEESEAISLERLQDEEAQVLGDGF